MTAKKKAKRIGNADRLLKDLNEIVRQADSKSALRGLEICARLFAVLIHVYAAPNPENSEGMCDDPAALRKYIAQIILDGPTVGKTVEEVIQ